MPHIRVANDLTIQYDVVGAGEPVVLIHGAFVANTFAGLAEERILSSRHLLISYSRRGYAGSSRTTGTSGVVKQASDCRALLSGLGVERAHVVGHSYGGCVALQLALDAPQMVHSLALLEPALMVGSSAESYQESLSQGTQQFRDAGAAVAVDGNIAPPKVMRPLAIPCLAHVVEAFLSLVRHRKAARNPGADLGAAVVDLLKRLFPAGQ